MTTAINHSLNPQSDSLNKTTAQQLLDSGQILAKDRFIINKLKNRNPKKAYDIATYSHARFNDRYACIPKNLADKLNTNLPVIAQADTLIEAIIRHQVVIVAGETGSGKTTQLPKLALLAGRGVSGQIGHTQPRRLAARSVAERIAFELNERLGQTVSFKVRFNEEGGTHSLIKLMTDGILLAELAYDKYLSKYDTIIIDEAHERSLNIDFILGYLKRLLPKRPDLKVIITSATLDTDRFSAYFDNAPVFSVQGRSYPVEIVYRPLVDGVITGSDDDDFDDLEELLPKALIAAIDECIDHAHHKNKRTANDILIFAATEGEIRELYEVISHHNFAHTEVLMLFARQSYSEQARIFAVATGRRIIISTNVAETALTVPNIGYVIDLGFARISRYSHRSRIQRLPIEAISQAAANQRAGRCGRVAQGLCIRLYSREDFEARPEFTEPEILRTNLASVILQMAYLGLGDVAHFDFITPPDLRLINDGKKLLFELQATHHHPTKTATKKQQSTAYHLSPIGKKMAKMPIDPRLARMLIAAYDFDCLADMLVIVSALSVQDIRERPFEKQAAADQKHALFRVKDSDFLFYLKAYQALFGLSELNYNTLLSANGRKNFAKKHFFNTVRVREWQKTHSQLSQMMAAMGFDVKKQPSVFEADLMASKATASNAKSPNQRFGSHNTQAQSPANTAQAVHYANIHRALLTALLSFVAKKTEVKGEYLMAKNQKGRIFPASILHKKGCEWLMAFEVVETSNVYMRINAKIEPEWVMAAAGDLLKYHYFEPHWSKKTGRVRAYAQISLFGLILVAKQVVNYERINPEEARKIFLQEALVLGKLGAKVDFLHHNTAKVRDVELAEDKLRRRDLLADELQLYQFYADKLPEHIISRKALLDYIGECGQDKFLYFEDKDVVKEDGITPTAQDFPQVWQMGALQLPLSYVFDPSSSDDGVSVKIPKEALCQLDAVNLLWGIAGWRFELVVALLKSLPKDIRRHLVPIPDTADKVFDRLDSQKPLGLLDQLSEVLGGMGIVVTPQQFNVQAIDSYLKPQICVINNKGQIIDKDRDLDKLQLKYKSHSQVIASHKGEYDSFPDDFVFVKNHQRSGVMIQEFSVLVKSKSATAVDKITMMDLSLALDIHKIGVLTLIGRQLGTRARQLTGQIDKAFKLAFAPLGDLQTLKNLLIDATLQVTFDKHAPCFYHKKSGDTNTNANANHTIRKNLITMLKNDFDVHTLKHVPLSKAEFEALSEVILANFLAVGQGILRMLKEIYSTWQTIRGQLLMIDGDVFGENIADIEDQLDDLLLADFVHKVDSRYWVEYPRYLAAIKLRLERLAHNIEGDKNGVYQLDDHMERISHYLMDKKFQQYRWLVEEFRINLFAQPMKTKAPISDKRLNNLWDKLTTR